MGEPDQAHRLCELLAGPGRLPRAQLPQADAVGHVSTPVPSHSQKKAKRYRYYVSEPLVTRDRDHAPDGLRLPAQELEAVVADALRKWLVDADAVLHALTGIAPEQVQSVLAQSHQLVKDLDEAAKQYSAIQWLVQQVIVELQSVQVIIQRRPRTGI